jgi:hypothetical protein
MENEICSFPLRLCFLADTILLAMKNVPEQKQLSDREKKVLEKALQFIETAVQGKQYVDSLTLGENCVEATRSYGAALKALRELKVAGDPSSLFDKYIKLLKDIKRTKESLDSDYLNKMKGIRDFFMALRTVSWERIEKPSEEVVLHGAP